jgi:hypothetical protein
MKNLRLVLLALICTILLAPAVYASPTVGITPNSTIYAESGDQLAFDLYLTNNDDISYSLMMYALSLQLDTTELSYVSWNYSSTNFNAPSTLYGVDSGAGTIYGINAHQLGYATYSLLPDTQLYLGTLTVDVLTALEDDNWDISLYYRSTGVNEGFYFTAGLSGKQLLSQSSGPDVASAVPIPGAVWLLGSGLLGLVSLRRRIG